jgi:TatD DNase family protein
LKRYLTEEDFVELFKELAVLPGKFGGCVHNSCDGVESIDFAIKLVEWGRTTLEGRIYAAFGIHPNHFEEYSVEVVDKIKSALDTLGRHGVAIGECGLDYYRRKHDVLDPELKTRMMDVFAQQARLAVARGLPLVVHTREAEADTMAVLRAEMPPDHIIHLHSWMGSLTMMAEFLEHWSNGCVGITGALSYEETGVGELHDIVSNLPLERMLLESDGPYMATVPFRGEESHCGQMPWIAEVIAKIKGTTTTEVLDVTYRNFLRVYNIPGIQ